MLLLVLGGVAAGLVALDTFLSSSRDLPAIVAVAALFLLPILAECLSWMGAIFIPAWRRLTIDAAGIRYRFGPHAASFTWDEIVAITPMTEGKNGARYRIETRAKRRVGWRQVLRIPIGIVRWLLAITGDFIATILAGHFTGVSFTDELGNADGQFLPAAFHIRGADIFARPVSGAKSG